jgi:P27 family predicted phage terminase small subunit
VGKRGPKPKPTALRVFEGDPGRLLGKREGEVLPATGLVIPVSPCALGEHGKAVWDEVAPQLFPIGCLTRIDTRLLFAYCQAWDDYFTAKEIVEKEGMTIFNGKGGKSLHPAYKAKNQAIQLIRQIGGEFGMSPSSRVGLNISPNKPQNSLSAFKAQ